MKVVYLPQEYGPRSLDSRASYCPALPFAKEVDYWLQQRVIPPQVPQRRQIRYCYSGPFCVFLILFKTHLGLSPILTLRVLQVYLGLLAIIP